MLFDNGDSFDRNTLVPLPFQQQTVE